MKIKKVIAKVVKNSRKEDTIQVTIKTKFLKNFKTSAPSGKSKGKYEVKPYAISLKKDVNFINQLDINSINNLGISGFEDLRAIEKLVARKIGGNSLFALEASILKAVAGENKQELYEFLGAGKKLPYLVGNAVGGGLHSVGKKGIRPDFQEFLFIGEGKTIKESVEINKKAYQIIRKLLKAKKRNDEGAWETDKNNEEVLEIMNKVRKIIKDKHKKGIEIGLDVAASSFYKNKKYVYKNKAQNFSKSEQVNYIKELIKKYNIYYIEDGLEENDFSGFAKLRKTKGFIVGDDLTTTNPGRLKKAIRLKAINAIIVKPNQIGSLIKTKEVIDLAHKYNIKTIISHRSGETMDNTIADLAVSWDCDFIKTGISGKVREAKLKRLVKIEKRLKK
jgi:enolase|tara:strand:+ start:427 stop:1599 length:1173 start_codon:yes stop_codon:yes gene_type:complete